MKRLLFSVFFLLTFVACSGIFEELPGFPADESSSPAPGGPLATATAPGVERTKKFVTAMEIVDERNNVVLVAHIADDTYWITGAKIGSANVNGVAYDNLAKFPNDEYISLELLTDVVGDSEDFVTIGDGTAAKCVKSTPADCHAS